MRARLRPVLPYLLALLLAAGLGEALGHSLVEAAWRARLALLGHPRVGIWQDDPRLGWRHRPGATGREHKWLAYDVRYRTDRLGHRVTPGEYGRPEILFVGGSFTFGHGVEDQEAFPARLARAFPGHKVVNAGTNGWGTGQALLAVEEALGRSDAVELVVYGFIANHLHRNHRRRAWLEAIARWGGRRNVGFEQVEGELIFRGLVGPEAALDDEAELRRAEVRFTRELLRRMDAVCRQRGVALAVVHLPDGTQAPVLQNLDLEPPSGGLHDLRQRIPYAEVRFRYDFHPTPEGHGILAEHLEPIVTAALGLPRARARLERPAQSGTQRP